MPITIVGTIGIDSIETPFGAARDVLGGSAAYCALAAAQFTPVHLIANIGDDLDGSLLEPLTAHRVDLSGIHRDVGPNFRWGGRYHLDFNARETLYTELGVLERFDPIVPPAAQTASVVFLANLQPELQQRVIAQTPHAQVHALDTMNFWIAGQRADLEAALRQVNIVFMAEDEVRQFAGVANLRAAARAVLALGPQLMVIKLGSYGALFLDRDDQYFAAPAFPLDELQDPTGAGDAFAGGFLGYLARLLDQGKTLAADDYRRALLHGNLLGSFTCERFGIERLVTLQSTDITRRYRELIAYTHITSEETLAVSS